ncbi:MAG: Com family DNA-binding transcriptional regulator [Cohaesibacteraceae bacterium]|nr:Com family DNA-binding transcriptional regulator [Cohaesibacteraceae bacterium]MBL4876715.1 Com family DNA-binding transcriptional regulator [Cohaesibacteraceae bacterium]
MESIRCSNCSKLLFKSDLKANKGRLEIKCSRCGTFNDLRPKEPDHECLEHLLRK